MNRRRQIIEGVRLAAHRFVDDLAQAAVAWIEDDAAPCGDPCTRVPRGQQHHSDQDLFRKLNCALSIARAKWSSNAKPEWLIPEQYWERVFVGMFRLWFGHPPEPSTVESAKRGEAMILGIPAKCFGWGDYVLVRDAMSGARIKVEIEEQDVAP